MGYAERIVLMAALLVQHGCAMPPVPVARAIEEVPFRYAMHSMVVGVTKRDTVVDRLGEPTVVRQGGRLLVYADTAWRRGFAWWPYDWSGEKPRPDQFYLIVELDSDDVVQRFETVTPADDDTAACTVWGVCVLGVAVDDGADADDRSLIAYTPEQSRAALGLPPDEGRCVAVVFSSELEPLVRFAGQPARQLTLETYRIFRPEAGTIPVEAIDPITDAVTTTELSCSEGESHYLAIDGNRGFWSARPKNFGFRLLPAAEGFSAIQERQLLME